MKVLHIISLLLSTFAILLVLSTFAPNADFEGGSGYAIFFAGIIAIPAMGLALIPSFLSKPRNGFGIFSLVTAFIPFVVVAAIVIADLASAPRRDVSATVTYVGVHKEIILGCGSFGGRKTKRGEIVDVHSIPRDGRIVVSWGPSFQEKQSADLNVSEAIPRGGSSVVVAVTLTDKGASFTIEP